MDFKTSLLDKAIEEKKKKQEELRVQLLAKMKRVLDALSDEVPFEEAYIFGSVTKPHKFYKNSDIDVGFVGLKDEYFFKVMSYISGEMGFDVDVIQLEGNRLSDKIKREGIRWKRKR
jgi:predicted nucleotidyltransferase